MNKTQACNKTKNSQTKRQKNPAKVAKDSLAKIDRVSQGNGTDECTNLSSSTSKSIDLSDSRRNSSDSTKNPKTQNK